MASSSFPQKILEYQEQRERSATSQKIYDAFISHRGPDVKDTLAKQLYELLQERGCRAFLDREEIEGGDSIPFAISNGICSSVVQIAIFSKRYAESKWCLDELVLMLAQIDALFIPVFYEVNPWELRHTEKGVYAAAFSDYRRKERYLDKLDEWKNALEFAANISGYELSEHKDNLCEKVVCRVLQEMEKRVPLHVAKYPVGLAEIVEDFEKFCVKTMGEKVMMVGIFGLGGSGKTTLAKELFNRKRSRYSASCFLSDVRESHVSFNLNSLQSQLFKDLFNENRVFRNADEGTGQLKHRLGRASHLNFLIVLDDIDHRDQLDALLPEAMLSSGSLVIITTRDQGLLTGAGINIRYRMKEMNRDHAKELFCSHAFRGPDPPLAYKKLVESFLDFCGGLPLSLKVLGAHVYGRDEYYWNLQLEKAKNIQPKDVMQSLKISFDGLENHEKQIFIDIACLFNNKEMQNIIKIATLIWNESFWSAEHAVLTLQEKCLVEVTVKHRHFQMHDHLRDLGRQMADDLGPPRLWRPDILRSMEAKGFKQTLTETRGRCLHSFKDSFLKTNIWYFVASSNDSAETELLLLHIGKIKIIPPWVPVQKLLWLTVSNVEELWSTFQQQLQTNAQPQASFRLRILRIFCSPLLQNLPDLLGKLSQLEELLIIRSLAKTDITSFTQSLKQLSNLRSLQLSEGGGFFSGNLILSQGRDSTNFEASTTSRMKSLETIKIRRLDHMSMLLISGKVCPRLGSLEVLAMRNLKEMSLEKLENLNSLTVKHCPKLETRISGLSSLAGLRVLQIMECEMLRSLPNLAHLCNLERIVIVDCNQLQSVQGVEELQGLKSLEIGARDWGAASVLKCIYGLKRLPSEHIILRGKPVERASSINLCSEMIGGQTVAEMMKRGEYKVEMSSSSIAITMYVLRVTSNGAYIEVESAVTNAHFLPPGGEWMITVILTPRDSQCILNRVTVHEGFKVTLNEGEEGKALTLSQRIVERLYGQSVLPNLAAYDAVKRKRKLKS